MQSGQMGLGAFLKSGRPLGPGRALKNLGVHIRRCTGTGNSRFCIAIAATNQVGGACLRLGPKGDRKTACNNTQPLKPHTPHWSNIGHLGMSSGSWGMARLSTTTCPATTARSSFKIGMDNVRGQNTPHPIKMRVKHTPLNYDMVGVKYTPPD
jgi:hypothetical protein